MNHANYKVTHTGTGKFVSIHIGLQPGITQALYASDERVLRHGEERARTRGAKLLGAQPHEVSVQFTGCDF